MTDAGPSDRTITSLIPARIDRLPWAKFHTMVIVGLGAAWILDGIEVQIVAANGFASSLHMSTAQVTAAATFYLFGQVLGALFFGKLTDRVGRKKLFTLTLLVYLLGSGIAGLSFAPWFLYLCRFIAGSGIGGEYSAINSAIDELIPARYRGRVDLAVNGTYWAGVMLGSVATIYLLDPANVPEFWGWRIGFFLGPVLGLVLILIRQHIPESPRYGEAMLRPDDDTGELALGVVLVVGGGKVACSLARALTLAGLDVALGSRHPVPLPRASQPWRVVAWEDVSRTAADLVVVAVSDDAIPGVASRLDPRIPAVHCSGASSPDALSPIATRGVWHPLMAFPTRTTPVAPSTVFGVCAGEPLACRLVALTRQLGCRAVSLDAGDLPIYHSAAVEAVHRTLASVEICGRRLTRCGFSESEATAAVCDLMAGSLRRAREAGPAAALTGPLDRGDVGTVRRHLAALDDEHAASYVDALRLVLDQGLARPGVAARLRDVVGPAPGAGVPASEGGAQGDPHVATLTSSSMLKSTRVRMRADWESVHVQLRTMIHGKIHRVRVTAADLNYVGSITVDPDLLDAAGIAEYERVQVVDINNGERLETYTIAGRRGSGGVQLNGAGARLVQPGDLAIIMAYTLVTHPVPETWSPRVVFVDDDNAVTKVVEGDQGDEAVAGVAEGDGAVTGDGVGARR